MAPRFVLASATIVLADFLCTCGALALTVSDGVAREAFDGAAEAIKSARSLSHVFRGVAGQQQGRRNATLDLLSSFQICSAGCREPVSFQRFGEPNDGGYQMCVSNMPKDHVAYSLGVGNHDKWSYHMIKRLNATVYQYDCFRTAPQAHVQKQGAFFPVCISGTSDLGSWTKKSREAITFPEMLKRTGQAKAGRGTLVLKMDIEGSEWGVLEDLKRDMLRKFSQIVIEFHQLSNQTRHASYLSSVRSILDSGFKVAHLHGNNQNEVYRVGEYLIPNVIEVTFVQEDGPDQCTSHIEDFPDEVANSMAYEKLPPIELPAKPRRGS